MSGTADGGLARHIADAILAEIGSKGGWSNFSWPECQRVAEAAAAEVMEKDFLIADGKAYRVTRASPGEVRPHDTLFEVREWRIETMHEEGE